MRRKERAINHTPEDECYKVVGNRAHFHINNEFVYHEFENIKAADKWKSERSIENRRTGFIEDWQACNPDGTFNFEKLAKLKRSMGIAQGRPESVAEMIGINDMLGRETDYDAMNEIQIHTPNLPRPRWDGKRVDRTTREKKLEQLVGAAKIPPYLRELFLSEIKLSTDKANAHLRDRAKLLGLM